MSVEEQRGTDHHGEERDPVPASRPGPCDDQKGVSQSDEYIRRGIVHAANAHATRINAAPMVLL